MTERGRVLELFHPRGRAPAVLVLGDGCPDELLPRSTGAGEPADLIVISPGRSQSTDTGWLAAAARRAAAALAPDGLIYVLAPASARRRLRALLRAEGMEVPMRVLHLPHWRSTRYMIPADADAIRFALGTVVPRSPGLRARARRVAVHALTRLGLGSSLPGALPIFHRPGAPPPLAWIDRIAPEEPGPATAVLRLKVRRGAGRVVLHRVVPGGRYASHVLKPDRQDPGVSAEDPEAARLQAVRAAAERAGARLPRVLGTFGCQGLQAQSCVRGRSAAAVLSESPPRLPELLDALTGWLASWHRETLRSVPLDESWLRRHVSHPAQRAVGEAAVPGAEAYLTRLHERCARLVGRAVPLVTAHNDLTMENVLVEPGEGPGVVDWEAAGEGAPPLVDFYYAVVDAVAAAGGRGGRAAAARDCFAEGGRHVARVAELERRLRLAAGVPPDFAALCFHACWLGHAAGERASTGGRGGFGEIVGWLAGPAASAGGSDALRSDLGLVDRGTEPWGTPGGERSGPPDAVGSLRRSPEGGPG